MTNMLRFQYPGAIFHVMARGDGGGTVFEHKDDCEVFLNRLGEACGSCGWQVHAWVLMENHFYLLLETPEANPVAGMKWLLAGLLASKTTASREWLGQRLEMGHPGSVSRMLGELKRNPKLGKRFHELNHL